MTTPERGLFERISTHVPLPNWPDVEDICAEHEQRLAEAEEARDSNARLFISNERVIAVRDAEIVRLRARCGELENIAHKANAVNEHWNEFGPEHGFDERMDHLHSALTAATQPAQQDECTRTGRHDWVSTTGGDICFYCSTMWWANTPEPKPAQEQTK